MCIYVAMFLCGEKDSSNRDIIDLWLVLSNAIFRSIENL